MSVGKLLSGQIALVTGANSGIGRNIALAMGEAGANVVVNYLKDPAAAEEVANKIRGGGSKAIAVRADVSREDEVVRMFESALREFGTIDILASNAGLQSDSAFNEMSLERWNAFINDNLTGAFLCAREAVKEFLRRGLSRGDLAPRARSYLRARCTRESRGRATRITPRPKAG